MKVSLRAGVREEEEGLAEGLLEEEAVVEDLQGVGEEQVVVVLVAVLVEVQDVEEQVDSVGEEEEVEEEEEAKFKLKINLLYISICWSEIAITSSSSL